MFNRYNTSFGKTKQKRKPIFTLKEFSGLVDVPYNTLHSRMVKTEDKPEVQWRVKTAKYYLYDDLIKWNESFVDKRKVDK